MGLESTTYISGLNASNPTTGDEKTEGDDHIRLIKSALLATFPNITGAVTPTHTQLLNVFSIPSNATSGTTATTAVKGQCYSATGNIEIPASVFAAGDVFSVYNNSASAISLTQGSGATLRLGGTTSSGTRTLAPRGFSTVWYVSATEAVAVGAGLT